MDIALGLGQVIILGAYFTIALFAPFLKLPARWETIGARVGWATFFLGCGLTHLHKLGHFLSGEPVGADLLHTIAVVLQVFGAPVFIICALPYVRHLPRMLGRLPEMTKAARE